MGGCKRALWWRRSHQRPRGNALEEAPDAPPGTWREASLASLPVSKRSEESTSARGGRPADAPLSRKGVEGGAGEGGGGKSTIGDLQEAANAATAEHPLQHQEDKSASGQSTVPADESSTETTDAADDAAPADARGRRGHVAAEGGAPWRKDAGAPPGLEIRSRPDRISNVSSTAAAAAAEGAVEIVIIDDTPADANSTPTTSPTASVTATPTSTSAAPVDPKPCSRTGRPNSKGSTLGPSGCRSPYEDKTGYKDNDGHKHDENEQVDSKANDERSNDNVRGAVRGKRRGRQSPRRAPWHFRRKSAKGIDAAEGTATADAGPRERSERRKERSKRRREEGLEEGERGVEREDNAGLSGSRDG